MVVNSLPVNMAVYSLRHSFLCNNSGLQIFRKSYDVHNNMAYIMTKSYDLFYVRNEISK